MHCILYIVIYLHNSQHIIYAYVNIIIHRLYTIKLHNNKISFNIIMFYILYNIM